ncbi:hypothetical protein AB0451_39480 [Streptomyces sp. NPDC052000]|uniref:hypothetical protein n=1 Tax=Streptomyces sp. NPDC052000 TaxID=3155676 RepID=UPI0034507E8D
MAKRSEIEQQIARLQADLENADTDDEVWIKDQSGTEIKVTGRRATSVLDRFKDLWATEEGADQGDDDAGDDTADEPPAGSGDQSGGTSYFSRRKK